MSIVGNMRIKVLERGYVGNSLSLCPENQLSAFVLFYLVL